ncbi:MAG: bifunctional helix-turn-helix transcriptional regulator/GNAT family N-acetyltransferase [Pseudomonadota bacterium]
MDGQVQAVRAASRELVRRWGFLGKGIAGTALTGSTVHAIIEIGRAEGLTAATLARRLSLEKSTVSRLIRGLVDRGLVREATSDSDGRAKPLHLTDAGRAVLSRVDRVADAQVADALTRLGPVAAAKAQAGLAAYAQALSPISPDPKIGLPGVEIGSGYVPGLLGRAAEIAASWAAQNQPFGVAFETRVAADMAEFLPRADRPANGIWHARIGGQIVGSVTIDGEDLGDNVAHLRWFFVADGMRGAGIGQSLMAHAMAHCDAQGFREVRLWTLAGLDAARVLYERHGFHLEDEWQGDQWGAEVTERLYVRPRQ